MSENAFFLSQERHVGPDSCHRAFSTVIISRRGCPCSKWRNFFIFAKIHSCAMDKRQWNYAVPVFGRVEEGRGSKMENAAVGGVFWLSMEELEDVRGEGKSAKGKGDTPEGWMFLPLAGPLFFLACQRKWEWSVLLMWSIAFLSVENQIPCHQGVLPKHVMSVWEDKINTNLRFCLLRRPGTKYRELFISSALCCYSCN